MSKDFLNFIGRGSAFNPNMGGNTSAFFLTDNDTTFNLIDCGASVFFRILDLELLENIKKVNVFITHTHDDHIGSLSSLILYCYYVKKIHINLYDFNMRLSGLPSILLSMGVNHKMYRLNKGINEDNMRLELGNNITIIGFGIDHVREIKSTAYEIVYDKQIIIYTGDHNDARINDDYFTQYGYDRIYTDCSITKEGSYPHVNIEQLCKRFAKYQRSKVYCMHLESEEAIELIKSNGFNVVELYTKNKEEK